jgi:peptidoglycan/LPS O-acetylase OafA/YrhL
MLNWLPAYLDLFGVGMLLAVGSAWWATRGSSPGVLDRPAAPWASWALALGAFVAVSNIGLPVAPLYTQTLGSGMARQALYGVFALLLVAPAVFGPQHRGPIRGLLSWRPVAALGVISYGVYLWHQAWIDLWLRWTGDRDFALSLWRFVPFVVVLGVLSAAFSWWGLERWVIRRRVPLFRARSGNESAKDGVVAPVPSPTTLVSS